MQLSGGWFDYFIAFGSGVLVSFTPCVYPVMPITASFIASANIKGSRWHGFGISLLYVLGMAIVYTGLAVLAALTGKVFGQMQNSSLFYFIIAAFLIFFSLAMFDKINFIFHLGSNGQRIKPDSLPAIVIGGMVSGLVVGPCTAPVLGSLLVYVASKHNIIHGASLMFVFAYGVGFSLILVGTFSGLLSRLPKSGRWLTIVKQLCAWILLVLGVYFFYKGIRLFF